MNGNSRCFNLQCGPYFRSIWLPWVTTTIALLVSFPSGLVLKVRLVNNLRILGRAESAHHVDAQFVGVAYLRTHAQ
jgi:hypothetical protein